MKFAPPFDQEVIDGWKHFTVRDEDKSGEFELHGEKFQAGCLYLLSIGEFLQLVEIGHYNHHTFGFSFREDMLFYYTQYFNGKKTKAYIHQITKYQEVI